MSDWIDATKAPLPFIKHSPPTPPADTSHGRRVGISLMCCQHDLILIFNHKEDSGGPR